MSSSSRRENVNSRVENNINFRNDIETDTEVNVKDKNVNIAKIINSGNSRVDVRARAIQDQEQED